MAPRCLKRLPTWGQNAPRGFQDRPKRFQDVYIEGSMEQVSSPDGPKRPQDVSQMGPRGPKMLPDGPEMLPRWFQDAPRGFEDRYKMLQEALKMGLRGLKMRT